MDKPAVVLNPLDFGVQAQIAVGIQKKGGHLYKKSLPLLKAWGFDGLADTDKEIVIRKGARQPRLVMCRLEDVVENVAAGALDIGIVSSDVLNKWRRAQREISGRDRFFYEDDLGPAGSSLRLGVRMALIDRWTGFGPDVSFPRYKMQAYVHWREALQECFNIRQPRPLVTCDKGALIDFLEKSKLDFRLESILERRGTVEAQGKLMEAPVVCDLVVSGETMRKNGYAPVESFEIAASRIVLIANKPKRGRADEVTYRKRTENFIRFLVASNTCTVPA